MFGDLVQPIHISFNELRCPVVIVQDSQHLANNGMIRLPNPNVDAEYGMYDSKDHTVYQVADCGSNSFLVMESVGLAIWRFLRRLFIRCGRQVRLQEHLSLLRRKWVSMFVYILVKCSRLSRSNHVEKLG